MVLSSILYADVPLGNYAVTQLRLKFPWFFFMLQCYLLFATNRVAYLVQSNPASTVIAVKLLKMLYINLKSGLASSIPP